MEPHGLLPLAGRGPTALRPGVGHGGPQAPHVLRPGPVHPGQRGLRPGHRYRNPGGLALRAGPGRGGRHGHSACRGARPAHGHRCGAVDVPLDAGVQRLAHPGAARRQRRDRTGRLARRVLGRGWGCRGGSGAGLCQPGRDPAGGGARAEQPGRRPRRLWPAAARLALPGPGLHRRLRHGGLLRVPGGLALRADQPLWPHAHAVQPGVLGQCGGLHRHLAVHGCSGRAFWPGAPGQAGGHGARAP